MHEQTISIDNKHKYFSQYFNDNLSAVVKPIGGIIINNDSPSRCYTAVASLDVYGRQIANYVDELMLDILAIGYKQEFLLANLNIDVDDFIGRVLVNVMSVFDSYSDKRAINKLFNHENIVSIDGYYNFTMRELKLRWLEIANLANGNSESLSSYDAVVQFVKFITESLPTRVQNLSLIIDEDNYYMFNSSNEIIENTSMPLTNCSCEDKALIDILLANPKTVIVYNADVLSHEFIFLCKQLFNCKVVKNS